jgi:ABC-type branched-subunit amino acid transport system substrate-binding protein
VVAVVGPEDPALDLPLSRAVEASPAIHIQPSLTTPPRATRTVADGTLMASERGVRLAPSVENVGCAIAQHTFTRNQDRVVVIAAEDAYDSWLAVNFAQEFIDLRSRSLTKSTAKVVLYHPGASLPDLLAEAFAFSPNAVLLATSPADGARVLVAWELASGHPMVPIYVPPSFKSDLLLKNLPRSIQARLVTIAPEIPEENRARFDARFARRFHGSDPLIGSYYYYDAVMLLALGLSSGGENSRVSSDRLREHMIEVSRSPGLPVGWEDIGAGLRAAVRGDALEYRGLVGWTAIDDSGGLLDTSGLMRFWSYDGQAFVRGPTAITICPKESRYPKFASWRIHPSSLVMVDQSDGDVTIDTTLKIFCSYEGPTHWRLNCDRAAWLSCETTEGDLPICPGEVPIESKYYDTLPHAEVVVRVDKPLLAPGLNMSQVELTNPATGESEPIPVFSSTSL